MENETAYWKRMEFGMEIKMVSWKEIEIRLIKTASWKGMEIGMETMVVSWKGEEIWMGRKVVCGILLGGLYSPSIQHHQGCCMVLVCKNPLTGSWVVAKPFGIHFSFFPLW